MKTKGIGSNIALMVIFGAIGLTQFSENVRSVQVLGLFACGAVVGFALSNIVTAYRGRQKTS